MERKRTAEIAALVLLAGAAVTGWARHVEPVTASSAISQQAYPATQQLNSTSEQASAAEPVATDTCAGQVAPRRASVNRTGYQSARYYPSQGYTAPAYHTGRSTGKSVAIVAGSAGVGAAVGALAGGGRGAGIGALAGGGAGLLYDRLTHKTHSGL